MAYPWLCALDPDVLRRLDVAELADPHPAALALGPTVVAYLRDARHRPGRIMLCQAVSAAAIGPERMAALAAAERANPGIVLVEYAPPAERDRGRGTDPEDAGGAS
ncbi:hypothetical protein [Amycolatopsis sp. CA-230715]|uniref:hypothetical protein n=1 Tax=Amycolatopsis sp. CA-230715 TaxID=2745196 RepID=UPI001C01D465|nr:hypothetical protein [Amycolatopsis sp. CA-230715]